ncbi:unnamed protein product [Trichobilharzia szidati]|nr:unnamed protein product [Trichobilharzia szidati]
MSEGSSILSCGPKRQYGTLESTTTPQNAHKLYTVKPGDTLVSIAVQNGTTVQRLRWINRLWSSDISNITTLKIPVKSQSESTSFSGTNAIELCPVKKKIETENEDALQIASASLYFKELSERVEKAKEDASRCLEKSRLHEIMADCDPTGRDCYILPRLSMTDETVVMVTSPTTSGMNSSSSSSSHNNVPTHHHRSSLCTISMNSLHDPC